MEHVDIRSSLDHTKAVMRGSFFILVSKYRLTAV